MDEPPEPQDFSEILRRILEVAPMLHSAGPFPARALEAIGEAARQKKIRRSAVQLPPRRFILGAAYRTVRKAGVR